ncbi:hypothetical protein CPB86DRAFT_878021 [Serendipita vermifera]|nr:hypothetical protein CPB86DRAFT_878021 [Serendipita vermifera]
MNHQTKVPKPGGLLVPDVIEIILQYLLIDDEADSRGYGQRRRSLRQSMCNYALIARAWRLPVQRILFAEVDISTHHKVRKMEYVIPAHTAKGKFLRGCVRSLRLWILGRGEVSSLRPEDIPAVMRQFPSLYELRLDTKDLLSFSPDTIRDFQKTPSIQALMLMRTALKGKADWDIRLTDTIDFDQQLLCKVSHWKLRRFVLGRGIYVQCRTSPSPPHRFEEFRFHGTIKESYRREIISGGIGWYLRNSMETLQVFSTTCSEYDPSMLPFGPNNGIQSVEVLRIHPSLFPFGIFRGLRELMWLDIQYSWRPHDLLPMEALSQMDNIMHLGFQFQPGHTWYWYFERDIMNPPNAGNSLTPPPALPVNVKRVSILGYSSQNHTLQSVQKQIQKQLGNDIDIQLYCSLKEYKEGVALKLIPRDYETPFSPKTTDYSTMTRLVNQAGARSAKHLTSLRTSKAKVKPPGKKPLWK